MPDFYYYKDKRIQVQRISNQFLVPIKRKESLETFKLLIDDHKSFKFREGISNTLLLSVLEEKEFGHVQLNRELNSIFEKNFDKEKIKIEKDESVFNVYSAYRLKGNNVVGINNEFILKFKRASNIKSRLFTELKSKNKISILKKVKGKKNTYLMSVPSRSMSKVLKTINSIYKEKDLVEYAHPNFLLNLELSAFDPGYSQQWAIGGSLITPLGHNANININIRNAWDRIIDNNLNLSPVNILVIDKGIELHEDYDVNIQFENTGQTTHGTKVTGIIGAISNNGIGLKGIVLPPGFPNFILHAANFPEQFDTIDSESEFIRLVDFVEHVLESLDTFTPENYPKVINMSFNFPYDNYVEDLDDLIDQLARKSLICNSVGNFKNYGEPRNVKYPAYKSNVLSVAACDHRGYWVRPSDHGWGSCYSEDDGFGTDINLCAPGTDIATTTPNSINPYVTDFRGTSAAVAFVSGVAALLFAIKPDLKPRQVKRFILKSCSLHKVKAFEGGQEILDPDKKELKLGKGIIDADKAVELLIDRYFTPVL